MSVEIIPKNTETAVALLEAADVAGVPRDSITTTLNGFNVPDEVAEVFHHGGRKPEKKAPTKKAAPRRSRKSAEKE